MNGLMVVIQNLNINHIVGELLFRYDIEVTFPSACIPCECNVGGAVDQNCNKLTGQCRCRSANIHGRACDTYVVKPLLSSLL